MFVTFILFIGLDEADLFIDSEIDGDEDSMILGMLTEEFADECDD